MSGPLLQVKHLSVGSKRHEKILNVIEDLNFEVHAGETLGIVGESGCGKSTAALALLRLTPSVTLPVTSGEVLFDDRDVMRMNHTQLREFRGRDVSMILQDPMTSLNPAFTLGKQIEEALAIHRRCAPHERRSRAIEALRRVRIADPEQRIDDYPHQLSGGMKQRVVGAIALACGARLLIADEPTTSLDVTTQAEYLELLKALQRESGMAMIFITHDFGVVAKMCDRVCVMYAGKIVESGAVRDIFNAPAHWYTRALLDSIPHLHEKSTRLISIEGAPPSLLNRAEGCRFAPRCSHAQEKCTAVAPPTTLIAAAHAVNCWFPKQ